MALTFHPCFAIAAASFALLLQVHPSRDIGSPRVSGSTNCSSAFLSPGCVCWSDGRPAPGFLTRPLGSTPSSSSNRPSRMVARASPVAAETSVSPPKPIARDSVAAQWRRVRSSRVLQGALDRRIFGDDRLLRCGVALHNPVRSVHDLRGNLKSTGHLSRTESLSYNIFQGPIKSVDTFSARTACCFLGDTVFAATGRSLGAGVVFFDSLAFAFPATGFAGASLSGAKNC